MKILIVGEWKSELHEEGVCNAFKMLGHDVVKFAWHSHFNASKRFEKFSTLVNKAQNKYMIGPSFIKLNRALREEILSQKPDLVFIYRGTHILSSTIRFIKRQSPSTFVLGYNNDDPFSPAYPRWKWRHFLDCVPLYDLVLAYRKHNLKEYAEIGAKKVRLLRSWFMPERNYPIDLGDEDKKRYECDVVFVGHYEDDGRVAYLEEIVRRGWRLKIFGPGYDWDPVLQNSLTLSNQVPVKLVWGDDYNKALCGAKIALCFFSKLNRDTYTRRCFEIPACGTLLLSEYSQDLAEIYAQDKEAAYFNCPEEMCSVVSLLLADEAKRAAIASAGYKRVWKDRHDVISRMEDVLSWVDNLRGASK